MSEFSFDLVDEPWLPCTDLDGNDLTLGLHDLLLRAHELRAIQPSNPLTEAALLRVLLAVVHRAVDGPRDSRQWKDLYQAGRFDTKPSEYLHKWRHRFDLFSADAPFYQTPGLLVIDEAGNPNPQSIRAIMPDLASGNRKTLFDHTSDETPVCLAPAEAACILVTAQLFSFGGLNRKATNLFGYHFRVEDSTMIKGVLVLLTGDNLFETLLLNLLIREANEPIPNTPEDSPVWERSGVTRVDLKKELASPPRGYFDLLTPKCRHLRLVPTHSVDGTFVDKLHIAQGEQFSGYLDPGLVTVRDKKGEWHHLQPSIDKLVWRDSLALFSFDNDIDKRPKAFRQVQAMRSVVSLPHRYECIAYAFVNESGPKVNPLAWRREKLSVPLSLLSDGSVVACLEQGMSLSEKGAGVLDGAVKVFMKECLPKNSKDVREKAAASGAVRSYWDSMEGHFHQFLLDLDDPDAALETWGHAISRTARESLRVCVRGRYRDSARSYRAWSAASSYLNIRLAKLAQ